MRFGTFLATMGVALCLGCGGDGGENLSYAKVSGVVLLDGKPVENATVTFSPKEKGAISVGITNPEGQFTMKTVTGRAGAVVGDHDVMVALNITFGDETSTIQPGDLAPPQAGEPGYVAPKASGTRWIIAEKYSKPGLLKATVPAGGLTDHKLEVTAK
jgi:hypothetical protein